MIQALLVVEDGAHLKIPNAKLLRSARQIREAYEDPKDRLWLATTAKGLCALVSEAGPRQRHRVLVLERLTEVARERLAALFRVVIARTPSGHFLPPEELFEALTSPNANELFIGATADPEAASVVLQTGDLRRLVVPFAWFRSVAKGPRPDMKRVRPTDFGRTVALGDYEVASDAILYDLDPDARRRLKERAVMADTSLGGAIRRLRLQRGLSRADFGKIAEKTLARIERNENTPRAATVAAIARRLCVSVDELRTF